MADLTDIQAAQSVKIIGADSSGLETNPLQVTLIGARLDTSFSSGTNSRPTITNLSSVILAANTNRKYVIISNQSGQNVFLRLGALAIINEGILLAPGFVYEIGFSNLWTGTINAVKAGGGAVLIDVFEGSV